MAKKSNFGNYSMIGKVFGGKPSARSRRQKKKDTIRSWRYYVTRACFGGLLLLYQIKKGSNNDRNNANSKQ
jgi:hypothetical protein